jgi:antitoxin PrlF
LSVVAKITSKGQVTIPKEVRDALHLKSGDRIAFDLRPDGSAVVRPAKVDIRDCFGLLKAKRHVSLEEMNRVIALGWAGKLKK